MNYEAVGIDEQKTAPLFYRWFDKTDYDNAIFAIEKILKIKYPDADIGFSYSKLSKFLDRYIIEARGFKQAVTERKFLIWKNYFKSKYGYQEKNINAYLKALMEAYKSGNVKDSIYKPWTYKQDEKETIGTAIFKSTKQEIIKPILIFSVLGIASYALFSKGIPAIIKK